MTEDANGLSREQVEAACEVMHDAYEVAAVSAGWQTQERSRKPWSDVPEANKATMRVAVRALLQSPIVAAMLAEARAEGRRDALAAYVGTAAQEGTTDARGASGGSAGGSESDRPGDGRTEPQGVPFAKVTYKPDESTAAMTGAGIRWQYGWLVAFPDGTYERVHDAYVTEVVHVMRLAV